MTDVAVITSVPALPTTGDSSTWTGSELALAEAAGLVFTHSYGPKVGQQVIADRATAEKFLHVCRITGLDPLTRQIYCIGRASKSPSGVDWSIQTSIDGFRLIADRTQKYTGQDDAEWLTADGTWVDVWVKSIHGAHPMAARVRVWRKDWVKPSTGIATWDSYAQTKFNGGLTSMWEKMGPLMLAKCAEALAFRKAFPQDLSGLYTSDEMSQAAVEQPQQASVEAQAPQAAVTTRQAPQARQAQAQPVVTVQEQGGRDWLAEAESAKTSDDVMVTYQAARAEGKLGQTVTVNGKPQTLREFLATLGKALRDAEALAESISAEAGATINPVVDNGGEQSAIWDPELDGAMNANTGEVA